MNGLCLRRAVTFTRRGVSATDASFVAPFPTWFFSIFFLSLSFVGPFSVAVPYSSALGKKKSEKKCRASLVVSFGV